MSNLDEFPRAFRSGRRSKYPFSEMQPGETLCVPGQNSTGAAAGAAKNLGFRKGWKFRCETRGKDCHITRIDGLPPGQLAKTIAPAVRWIIPDSAPFKEIERAVLACVNSGMETTLLCHTDEFDVIESLFGVISAPYLSQSRLYLRQIATMNVPAGKIEALHISMQSDADLI